MSSGTDDAVVRELVQLLFKAGSASNNTENSAALVATVRQNLPASGYSAPQTAWQLVNAAARMNDQPGARRPLLAAKHLLALGNYPEDVVKDTRLTIETIAKRSGLKSHDPAKSSSLRNAIAAIAGRYGSQDGSADRKVFAASYGVKNREEIALALWHEIQPILASPHLLELAVESTDSLGPIRVLGKRRSVRVVVISATALLITAAVGISWAVLGQASTKTLSGVAASPGSSIVKSIPGIDDWCAHSDLYGSKRPSDTSLFAWGYVEKGCPVHALFHVKPATVVHILIEYENTSGATANGVGLQALLSSDLLPDPGTLRLSKTSSTGETTVSPIGRELFGPGANLGNFANGDGAALEFDVQALDASSCGPNSDSVGIRFVDSPGAPADFVTVSVDGPKC